MQNTSSPPVPALISNIAFLESASSLVLKIFLDDVRFEYFLLTHLIQNLLVPSSHRLS